MGKICEGDRGVGRWEIGLIDRKGMVLLAKITHEVPTPSPSFTGLAFSWIIRDKTMIN